MKLEKLQSILKPFSKNSRTILNTVHVTSKTVLFTDLESYLVVNDNFNLEQGIHSVAQLGEFSKKLDFDISEFPAFTDAKTIENCTITLDSLKVVASHASNDETRIFLNGVCFDKTSLVATNGYHLRQVALTTELQGQYIIPNDSLKLLFKLCAEFKVKNLNIEFSEDFATYKDSNFSLKMRLIRREYLKWSSVFSKKYANAAVVTAWPEIKKLMPFVNKRSNACSIEGVNQELFLIIPSTDIKILIGTCSEDFIIGFNIKFLELASEKTKSFTLKYNGPLNPCLVNESIVMPLKI